MMSIASSITSRLRRPRKSIFSRPISSIGPIEYWVTILYWRSGLPALPSALTGSGAVLSSASCSGTTSCSGRSAITTAAAWIELLRMIPSRPLGDVDDLLRVGLGVVGRFQVLPRLRHSAKDGLRPMIGSGISFARRSPVP